MPDVDPVFLITGASSGIGEATARAAAEAGYRLVLAARSEDRLQSLARELGGDERAIAVCCDVTEWDDQDSLHTIVGRESRGHLLITSSLAGRRPLPGSLYSATRTPLFEKPGRIERLRPEDVAAAVMYAVTQPPRVDLNEILVRPTAQDG